MNNIPNIPKQILDIPVRDFSNPEDLFYYYVRKLIKISQHPIFLKQPGTAPIFQFYNHSEAANKVFENGLKYKHYVTTILESYEDFFQIEGHNLRKKFRPDLGKLQKYHPNIFGKQPVAVDPESVKKEMLIALTDEKNSLLTSLHKELISLLDVKLVENVQGIKVYTALCFQNNDSQIIHLPEGVMVTYKVFNKRYLVTILEYDSKSNTLIFQSSTNLDTHSKGRPSIENSPVHLIKNISERIDKVDFSTNPFSGLFLNQPVIKKFELQPSTPVLNQLDESQRKAVIHSLSQNISYVWGPPGTGKSFTIARLLLNMLLNKERTLVCTIANVAIDGLAMKLVETINSYEKNILRRGEVLRIGFVSDLELKKMDDLFPEDKKIRDIRYTIQNKEELIDYVDKNDKIYARLKSELYQAKKELSNLLKEKIKNARIILCTSSKALLEGAITDSEFDNLVIDEGSMMSPVVLAGLINNIKKRVVITGDFKQLGPIANCHTGYADKWLHTNLFNLLGEKIANSKELCMLEFQRRCHRDIINLVNNAFYDNKLKTIENKQQLKCHEIGPRKGHVVFVDLGKNSEYRTSFDKNDSRYNLFSLKYTMDWLTDNRYQFNIKTLGIITPYRAQVGHYQKHIDLFIDKYKPSFSIKVGTIHTFQGSECDLIIFDMVESKLSENGRLLDIGKLFFGRTGEQLVNVAISRAISKLIVIGCADVLEEGKKHDQVSRSVKNIIRDVIKNGYSKG